jgi:hypothetical protein
MFKNLRYCTRWLHISDRRRWGTPRSSGGLFPSVQAGEPGADGVEFDLAEGFVDSREDAILLQADVVVKQGAERDEGLGRKGSRKRVPDILNPRAYGRMVGKHAHDFGVLIEAEVASVLRQKDLLFFHEVGLATFVPEVKRGVRQRTQFFVALGGGQFRRSANFQRQYQRVMMMFAEGVKIGVTLHGESLWR